MMKLKITRIQQDKGEEKLLYIFAWSLNYDFPLNSFNLIMHPDYKSHFLVEWCCLCYKNTFVVKSKVSGI